MKRYEKNIMLGKGPSLEGKTAYYRLLHFN